MTRRPWLLAMAAVACSNFTTTPGGITRLDVEITTPAEIEAGQTLKLVAVARDQNGDAVDVPVYWRALDTTLTVDSVASLVTGRTPGKAGSVVARAVDLFSDTVRFKILFPADTVYRVEEDSVVTVAAGTTTSAALVVQVDGGDPRGPVEGRRVVYEVVSPTFDDPADRTVEFSNSALVATATTSTQGVTALLTLRRRSGTTQPDTAIVRVSVFRPGAEAIPGSGLRFLVLFER